MIYKKPSSFRSTLQSVGIDRLHHNHLHLAPLSVFILLDRDIYHDLVKHRYNDLTRWRRDGDGVVFGIIGVQFLVESDKSLQAEPIYEVSHCKSRHRKAEKEKCSLGNKHRQTVLECSNDPCLFLPSHANLLASTLTLQSQTDIEFHTRPSGHLRKPMSFVDSRQDPFDMGFRLKGGMERGIVDGRSKLAVREDVGISADWGLPSVLSV